MGRLQSAVDQCLGRKEVILPGLQDLQYLLVEVDLLVKRRGRDGTGLGLFTYPFVSVLTVLTFNLCKLRQSGSTLLKELIKVC